MNSFANNTQSVLGSVFSNVQSAISNFVRTGKFDFKELMRSIVDDLLKLVTSKLFNQFLGSFGGGGFGGGLFGGGGGLFGGFLGGGLLGFADGGYTGNGSRTGVAGVVHGQEFVMPADATRRNRPILEAMRNGAKIKGAKVAGSGLNQKVVINNYAGSDVKTKRDDEGNLEITIREIANQEINARVPRIMANQQRNPNTRFSKAQGQSTNSKRRR